MKKLNITVVYQGLALTSNEEHSDERLGEVLKIQEQIKAGAEVDSLVMNTDGKRKFVSPNVLKNAIIVTEVKEDEVEADEEE